MNRPNFDELRSIQFFSEMSNRDLRMVARFANTKKHSKGEIIIREDTVADTFYIIQKGKVAITKKFEDGEEMVLAVQHDGEFFGEMALLDQGPRSASAVALESTVLLEISRNDFAVLLKKAPLLAYSMMRELSARLRGTGALLISELQRKNRELRHAYRETVNAVVNTLEARDPYTHGHTERVTAIAKSIASSIALEKELDEDDLFTIEIGALLHDVGKIGVPDAVLRKPGPLEIREILQIQEHPAKGKHILDNIGYLEQALPCILHHHERFDGQGYPEQIAGEMIPLPGRIISVADAFDAMTSDRPYRKKMDYQSAFREIEENAGRQFDPEIVEAFGKLLKSGMIEQLIKAKKARSDIDSTAGIA
ncbi:MAG: cyclic nucleotide-binding domain-containing protein [Spirochaetaceae bacterium]|nr:MAG: cyclic nucleotide-binding domain-containing protein [Spirochaetaceae bacterium]